VGIQNEIDGIKNMRTIAQIARDKIAKARDEVHDSECEVHLVGADNALRALDRLFVQLTTLTTTRAAVEKIDADLAAVRRAS
jgi:hypothetical protein